MDTFENIRPQLDRLQKTAFAIGIIGALICVVGAVTSPEFFVRGYLPAYLFWLGVTTGSLFLVSLHHTVGGGWGFIIRRPLEAAIRLLPLMLLLFIPIGLGMTHLYGTEHGWMHPYNELDRVLKLKSVWLNQPFFLIRVLFYFATWIAFAYFFYKWSGQQDESDDPKILQRLTQVGPISIVWYIISITLAAVDWSMSLTPHWLSSIYGLIFVVGQGLSTMCLMLLLVNILGGGKPPVEEVPNRYFRDLGNLTLAGTLRWAYTAFSQYIITYSGNLQEYGAWYVARQGGGWNYVGFGLLAFHFCLPFLALLSSGLKVKIQNLSKLALFILVMRFVDLCWLTLPNFYGSISEALPAILFEAAAFAGIGGIWLGLWAGQFKLRPLMPKHDPRLNEYWPIGGNGGHGHAGHANGDHGHTVQEVSSHA
jgi:hypothetical protein